MFFGSSARCGKMSAKARQCNGKTNTYINVEMEKNERKINVIRGEREKVENIQMHTDKWTFLGKIPTELIPYSYYIEYTFCVQDLRTFFFTSLHFTSIISTAQKKRTASTRVYLCCAVSHLMISSYSRCQPANSFNHIIRMIIFFFFCFFCITPSVCPAKTHVSACSEFLFFSLSTQFYFSICTSFALCVLTVRFLIFLFQSFFFALYIILLLPPFVLQDKKNPFTF